MMQLRLRAPLVIALLLTSVGAGSAQSAWVLWVKSSNLWMGSEKSPSGQPVDEFPTKEECLSRMEQVMNEIAAWWNSNGIQVIRDGDSLHVRITNPPNPPRLATVNYSCVPNTV